MALPGFVVPCPSSNFTDTIYDIPWSLVVRGTDLFLVIEARLIRTMIS